MKLVSSDIAVIISTVRKIYLCVALKHHYSFLLLDAPSKVGSLLGLLCPYIYLDEFLVINFGGISSTILKHGLIDIKFFKKTIVSLDGLL